ncbi:MAG TPA: hypothetical protein VMK31_04225 [Sphingomicrobium sp.]|nr:hypothetical protein [Sphingomicrobium sp.]
MTAAAAIARRLDPLRMRFRLPDRVPPFNIFIHRIFTLIWAAALALALIGPAMALYDRYSSPGDNSQLVLASRAGFAVSLQDATHIRFLIGPEAREAGIRKGDDIIAIYGLPLPAQMPMTDRALAEKGDDPGYIAMGSLLFGTDELPVPLTVRSTDGSEREVVVTTGEHHIDNAAQELGVSPMVLTFIDVVHVIFYPFLICAAWILHRRNSRDAVSSVLSLAILLMIGAEHPSANFLSNIGVARDIHVAIYDIGNVLLLAGILLFPYGKLTTGVVALVCSTPLLIFLQGQLYQSLFLGLLIAAVLVQIRRLRTTEPGDIRQQIRWALFGFSGYALFTAVAYGADIFKWSMESFPGQIALEAVAGLSFGLSVLVLQAGLLVALIRYRLYDAEAVISRTASIAIVTLIIIAVFGGVMEAIIEGMQTIYPDAEMEAAIVGAVVATALIHPLHARVERWTERRFQKSLVVLREELPEVMRDTRDSASLDDFLADVLSRIVAGVHATRAAVILEGEVKQTVAIAPAEVLRWFVATKPQEDEHAVECVPEDHLFPLRVEIETSAAMFGWLLIGPRPDGSIPGNDEQEALEKISGTLGRSARIVFTREEEKEELMRLLDAHSERISRIEQLLKAQ